MYQDSLVGNHVFTWTIDNGPCENAITVDTIVIHVFPDNPQVALAGSDQQLCTPDSSVILTALMPAVPSTATWVPISLATISNENDPSGAPTF